VENRSIEDGCLCGEVHYRATKAPTSSHICHCENCQHASAAPFAAWLSFPAGGFAFIKGQPVRYRYAREDSTWAERAFCARCGTQLTYTSEDHSDTFDVTTCSLDAPEAFPPDSHEWTAEKLSWIELWTLPNVKEV